MIGLEVFPVITFRATPSCSAGVAMVVAVTTTGSTFFVSGFASWVGPGFVSCVVSGVVPGFVSCAAPGTATASIAASTAPSVCLTTAPFLSKGGAPPVAIRSPDSWIVAAARPSRDVSQWLPLRGYGRGSPLTVAGPCRLLTGFPWVATITARAVVSPPVRPEHADRGPARGGMLVHHDPAAIDRFQYRLLQHVAGGRSSPSRLPRGGAGDQRPRRPG